MIKQYNTIWQYFYTVWCMQNIKLIVLGFISASTVSLLGIPVFVFYFHVWE